MIEDLYIDFSIPIAPEGHKHYRPGWVNTECVFCTGEHHGYHLGFNEENKYFYCFRCGYHPLLDTLAKLIRSDKSHAKELARHYKIYKVKKGTYQSSRAVVKKKPLKLPSSVADLEKRHRKYLKKRGFDPDYLAVEWGVLGTGPVSTFKLEEGKKINYKNRILVPIYWDGERVSFQTRDITDKHPIKYIACPQEYEKIDHKRILYKKKNQEWLELVIVVEGVFDVWRIGERAVGTFGIEYSNEQLRILSKNCTAACVLFDSDRQAQKQAKKMVDELRARKVIAWREAIETDPADLTQKQADQLVQKIVETYYNK